jgi:ribosomal protein S18 acetylase RimI-like enzyme
MQIQIRKATKQDCPAIMQLVQELAEYEKEPDAVTVTMEHFIESGFGEKPVWEAFVAVSPSPRSGDGRGEVSTSPRSGEDRGEVVGFALYYIRYSTWKGQRMYLEDLLVTDAMRGKGVGKLLMDKLIEECKAKKYSGLVWQVLDWNEPAINFYKKYDGVVFDGEWVNCRIDF